MDRMKEINENYVQTKPNANSTLLPTNAMVCEMRIADQSQRSSGPRTHEWIDRRSLALHEAVAGKLQQQPDLLQKAKTNLTRWIQQRQPTIPAVLREWQRILETWPIEKILELLRSSDQEARRLRQSSPFCGILSAEERVAIFKEYEALRA
jgi:hypothetical protein